MSDGKWSIGRHQNTNVCRERGQALPLLGIVMALAMITMMGLVTLANQATELAVSQSAADAVALAMVADDADVGRQVAEANNATIELITTSGTKQVVEVRVGPATRTAAAQGNQPDNAGLAPAMAAAIATTEDRLGHNLAVSSGFRSFAEQTWRWEHRASNPHPVAHPGTSRHETGLAIDISSSQAEQIAALNGITGLCRPMPVLDPVHFELCPRS
jgi:LAS superfamily LD-carboxypeptidase LdcB